MTKTKCIGIDKETRETLAYISAELNKKGYLVLSSQWMKNPLCDHYVAPICIHGKCTNMGYVTYAVHSGHEQLPSVQILIENQPLVVYIPTFDFDSK